jgi:hypothetical protein
MGTVNEISSLRVGCQKCEVVKIFFHSNSVIKNPVGMTCRYRKIFNSLNEDRHVIPTGFF